MVTEGKGAVRIGHWHNDSREYPDVDKQLRALQSNGEIGDGIQTPFDDSKVRLHNSFVIGSRLYIAVGPTWYQQFKEDRQCAEEQPEKIAKLKELGESMYDDPWAFFSRVTGAAIIPLTKEGHTYVGKRSSQTDLAGTVNAAAGLLTYHSDFMEIDPLADALRELEEEYGISKKDISSTRIVGVASNPVVGDADITFIAQTTLSDEYFDAGEWKRRVREPEHDDLIRIASPREINHLLYDNKLPTGENVRGTMYSTRMGLEFLAKKIDSPFS